ncbi:sigma-54-dependent Fis family transcriptional regulator [bacterium]|nr:sigma-54-dependent Fis family transcriptional regulator [bacterium]
MGNPEKNATVLVVDDEESILETLAGVFSDEGYKVRTAMSGEQALLVLEQVPVDLVFLDIWLPGIDGLMTLDRITANYPQTSVVMISGHGTIETAVEAAKKGAYYFIEKPIDLDKILLITKRALERRSLEQENITLRQRIEQKFEMIGRSTAIKEIRFQIEAAAPSNGRVLIHGENGTGKELVARAIHSASKRNKAEFVEVNCAAIPEDLIESELFGHEKGSFTGATVRKIGKFELAHGGTIFLDEVGDMSLKTQAKVLRVLEEQKIERVGGTITIEIDVRVIAASNKDLVKEIEAGTFREDLYYRLNVIPITVPPLRDRLEDIKLLCDYYLKYFCRENGKKLKKLSDGALQVLQNYRWPGNIRELKNVIERLVIMVQPDLIDVSDIPPVYRRQSLAGGVKKSESGKTDELFESDTLKTARDNFEKVFILAKLQENNWNISKTAEIMKIERSNLHRKMKLLGISVNREDEKA